MLVKATIEDVLHVARNMREIDRREVFAMRWGDSPETLAHSIVATRGDIRWCAMRDDGEPVYVFGAMPTWPGKWDLWGFSTDRWPDVWREVTKHILRNMIPALRAGLGHRIDCITLAEKVEGHRWLRHLGGVEIATIENFGRNGEAFKWFEWR